MAMMIHADTAESQLACFTLQHPHSFSVDDSVFHSLGEIVTWSFRMDWVGGKARAWAMMW